MSGAWKEWEGRVVNGVFRLQRFIGSGEQTAVFFTQYGDAGERDAAIKLVRTGSEDTELQLSRWKRAAQLSHSHLVRLIDSGVCGEGLLYTAMEYGEENLGDILRERPLEQGEAREMLQPVLEALVYLHQRGLVHGRVKPANILAVADQVKISSDGICEAGKPGRGWGEAGVYDPPEFRTRGNSPAGDVWSLGMTLVEALTQQLPDGRGADGEMVLPETLPPAFVDIARDCLRTDPERRPAVGDIAARLRGETAITREPDGASPPERSRMWRFAAAAAASLALAAIVLGTGILRRPAPVVAPEQPKARAETAVRPDEPKVSPFQKSAVISKKSAVIPKTDPAPVPAPPVPVRPEPKSTVSDSAAVGRVVRQVLPSVPRQARETIRGTVKVSVRAGVDRSGHVVSATLDSPGPSKYFAGLALEAVRHWEFEAPKSQGKEVPSEWILRFDITQTATTVRPVRVTR